MRPMTHEVELEIRDNYNRGGEAALLKIAGTDIVVKSESAKQRRAFRQTHITTDKLPTGVVKKVIGNPSWIRIGLVNFAVREVERRLLSVTDIGSLDMLENNERPRQIGPVCILSAIKVTTKSLSAPTRHGVSCALQQQTKKANTMYLVDLSVHSYRRKRRNWLANDNERIAI